MKTKFHFLLPFLLPFVTQFSSAQLILQVNPEVLTDGCTNMYYGNVTTIQYQTDTLVIGAPWYYDSSIDSVQTTSFSNVPAGLVPSCGSPNCMAIQNPGQLFNEDISFYGIPTSVVNNNVITMHHTFWYSIFGAVNFFTDSSQVIISINELDLSVTVVDLELTANQVGASYQWLQCPSNEPIPGATSRTFTAPSAGEYAVYVDATVCSSTSECYLVAEAKIDEYKLLTNVSVYPNPTSGIFSIELDQYYHNVQLSITDLRGREVYAQKGG